MKMKSLLAVLIVSLAACAKNSKSPAGLRGKTTGQQGAIQPALTDGKEENVDPEKTGEFQQFDFMGGFLDQENADLIKKVRLEIVNVDGLKDKPTAGNCSIKVGEEISNKDALFLAQPSRPGTLEFMKDDPAILITKNKQEPPSRKLEITCTVSGETLSIQKVEEAFGSGIEFLVVE